MQEKLDKLLVQVDEAGKASSQLECLGDIHDQVKATAAEVRELVAKQTQLITDGNEAKEREAEELALLIERKTTQREQLDNDIDALKAEKERIMQELKEEKERAMAELREEKERDIQELKEEKDSLLAIVASLQAERENLADQKVRLTGQVSSLHTALEIRREELHLMDAKADALERRIINGMMDHSRALMIAKNGKKSPVKVKKRMSIDPAADANKLAPPSAAANGISMALKPRPAIRRNGVPQNPGDRRIHSLSQISGNAPTGAQAFPATKLGIPNAGLKRSQSVRTQNLRKGSWGGRPSAAVANKENEVLSEEDENAPDQVTPGDAHSIIEEDRDEMVSEAGTQRRHSLGTASYVESYADGGSARGEGRSDLDGTDSMYSGSSYFTNSEVDRRTSFGSTTHSAATYENETIDENSEDEISDLEHSDEEPTATVTNTELGTAAPSEVDGSEVSTVTESDVPMHTESEINRAVEQVVAEELAKAQFTAPSDSGVGSELPTADLGKEAEATVDADYFRRAAEEASTVG